MDNPENENNDIPDGPERGSNPEITSLDKIKEALPTFVGKLCIVLADHASFNQPGILMTDGRGFGFNGGIGFLPDAVEKIYPITVETEKNQVRAVIFLKKPQ